MYIYGRGTVDNATACIRRRCSLQYLHGLYLELSRARSFMFLSTPSRSERIKQSERLDFVAHELQRLVLHPGLYPSIAVKARFVNICFHLDSEYNLLKTCRNLLVNNEVRHVARISHNCMTRTSYLHEGYGWENFLLPNSPGLRISHKQTEPASAFQVLPGTGMRICSDLAKDENDIHLSAIDRNKKKNPKNLPFNMGTQGQRCAVFPHPEQWPTSRLRYHSQNVVLQPSPFKEEVENRLDIQTKQPSSLEHFSQMLYRLEQHMPFTNAPAAALNAPNAFPIMALRSWPKPFRHRNVNYHACYRQAYNAVGTRNWRRDKIKRYSTETGSKR